MTQNPDLRYALTLAPEAAIEYFESLNYRVSRNALDAYNAARHQAFTVAGITELDLVGDIKKGLEKALRDGTTFRTFQEGLDEFISKRGWMKTETSAVVDSDGVVVASDLAPYRLETIFRTNLQSAYMAGKYKQLQEDAGFAPFWQYIAVMDDRTRPSHAAANGMVFHHEDPFWDSHYPPCDYNCRCTVRALRERDLDRFDLKPMSSEGLLSDEPQAIGKHARTVTVFKHPTRGTRFAPRAGFGQRPKFRTKDANLGQVVGDKLEKADGKVAAKVLSSHVDLKKSLIGEFEDWFTEVTTIKRANNSYRVVGAISPEVNKALAEFKIHPNNAAITLRDSELLHMIRDSKNVRKASLPLDSLKKLPELLDKPIAVYLDRDDEALIYVISQEHTVSEKVVVRMNYIERVKHEGERTSLLSNSIRTAGKISVGDLRNERYELIWGNLES